MLSPIGPLSDLHLSTQRLTDYVSSSPRLLELKNQLQDNDSAIIIGTTTITTAARTRVSSFTRTTDTLSHQPFTQSRCGSFI
ncbi:hypothetical protein PTI98_009964 [Pleurotus ostreatus]|nr:hypothetical protein PTI98_009964 [Pleurotus ostreatus]